MVRWIKDARLKDGVRVIEQKITVQGTEIPIITMFPDDFPNPNTQRILMVYGGSIEKNFSRKAASFWGPTLAGLGLVVHCFEFRSNLEDSHFYDYGLHDRLVDLRAAFQVLANPYATQYQNPFASFPLSLMGVSMGSYLSALVTAENPNLVYKLVLAAPAAYNDQVLSPKIKFGPEFSKIIRQPDSWRSSSVFTESNPKIKSDCLIFVFQDDEIMPREIPSLYFNSMGTGLGRRYLEMKVLESPGHKGTFEDTERRTMIVQAMKQFLRI